MNKHDVLLVMTICELLGKSVDPKEVKETYEAARQRMDRLDDPPEPGYISRAPRR